MYFRTRGYLPHLEPDSPSIFFITFRLNDSLPVSLLQKWREEYSLQKLQVKHNNDLQAIKDLFFEKLESMIDSGLGQCWLNRTDVATMMVAALKFFDHQRYELLAWTVMPNHVHVLFYPIRAHTIREILQAWKSFTAHRANKLLNRSGIFWQREYFDCQVRSKRQLEFCIRYILNNPVKAGLCKCPHEWPYTGYSADIEEIVRRFLLD
jgi:REP element-mobilizing transposase RayT